MLCAGVQWLGRAQDKAAMTRLDKGSHTTAATATLPKEQPKERLC